jgi:DNA-binding transcriptional LysR family regulator
MLRAELKQYEALYWIAKLGSFRAAAEHLHITQPAISVCISELELALDAKLFDRSSHRATLTAWGREFESIRRALSSARRSDRAALSC